MLFLAQQISNHSIALRTVFAEVADPPEKQTESMDDGCLHVFSSMYKEDIKNALGDTANHSH